MCIYNYNSVYIYLYNYVYIYIHSPAILLPFFYSTSWVIHPKKKVPIGKSPAMARPAERRLRAFGAVARHRLWTLGSREPGAGDGHRWRRRAIPKKSWRNWPNYDFLEIFVFCMYHPKSFAFHPKSIANLMVNGCHIMSLCHFDCSRLGSWFVRFVCVMEVSENFKGFPKLISLNT